MTIGNTPLDLGSIPLGTVISPNNTGQTTGNVIPVPLQGHPGSFLDSSQNPTTSAMFGYMYPQIVQSGHSVTGSGAKTLTFTFANSNNQGNSIVVCLGMGEVDNGSTITLAVTDNAGGGGGNTYQRAISNPQSTTLESAIFFATKILPGANTVTVTIAGASSSNTAISMEVYEVWGSIALAGSLDQTNIGNAASGTAVTTGAISPPVPNTLAFMAVAAAGGTIAAGSGWTSDTSGALSPSGGNLVSFEVQSQLLTTIASVTPSATLGTSNAWTACCATFKSIIVPVEGTVIATQPTAANLNAQVVGGVASAGTNAGNPVKTGGVFNTTQPTVTNGQIVDLQSTARGAQIVATGVDIFNATPYIQSSILNGQAYLATTTNFATATNANLLMGASLYNPGTKNIFVYSAKWHTNATTATLSLRTLASDPLFSNSITPSNLKLGGTGSTANITSAANNATASLSTSGMTTREILYAQVEGTWDFFDREDGILLPSGSTLALILFGNVSTAGNNWGASFRYIEF